MIILDSVRLKNQFKHLISVTQPHILRKALRLQRFKAKEMKLPLEDILTLLCRYRVSGFRRLNFFWFHEALLAQASDQLFIGYKNFCKWVQRCGDLLALWLQELRVPFNQRLGFIDSTRIPVCEATRWIKSLKGHVGKGETGMGPFYGLKLHVLIREDGALCNFSLTKGNVDDRTPIKEGVFRWANRPHLCRPGICFTKNTLENDGSKYKIRSSTFRVDD